jgi:hypothetical protein
MSECLIDKRLIKVVDSIRVLYPNVCLSACMYCTVHTPYCCALLASPLAAEVQQPKKKVEAVYNSFAYHRDLDVISRCSRKYAHSSSPPGENLGLALAGRSS